mgnify:CR=1 FL=1
MNSSEEILSLKSTHLVCWTSDTESKEVTLKNVRGTPFILGSACLLNSGYHEFVVLVGRFLIQRFIEKILVRPLLMLSHSPTIILVQFVIGIAIHQQVPTPCQSRSPNTSIHLYYAVVCCEASAQTNSQSISVVGFSWASTAVQCMKNDCLSTIACCQSYYLFLFNIQLVKLHWIKICNSGNWRKWCLLLFIHVFFYHPLAGQTKLGKVITPDPWKSGARNTTGLLCPPNRLHELNLSSELNLSITSFRVVTIGGSVECKKYQDLILL